ncbi:unnamed protein product [Meganyctiphanes norvegica]|uniref:Glucosylceramidase n=1 Tax=Meganyctiphanes norvegica TaxID=48144 RepID=A0AAV2Q0P2_MEGNR
MTRATTLAWLLSLVTSVFSDEQLPCVPRQFEYDSVVCVCNATYCDTLPRPSPPPAGEFLLFTSDLQGLRLHKTNGYMNMENHISESETAEGAIHFTLDPNQEYQTVMGWGAAFTDAAAFNILSLSEPTQEMLLKSYFGSEGLEYNIGRVNIGGCDFSWRPYTYDDVEGDVDLSFFELQSEDIDYKIPLIHRANAMSGAPLKLFASPWSAPAWMKTNEDIVGYGHLKTEMYQPWANYFVKFLDGYSGYNLSFWGLTAQNEPIDGYVPGFFFNCMGWTAKQQQRWVAENLGPTLEEAGYGDIKLMILDDQRFNLPGWAETVMSNPDAAKYVDGIAVHIYTDSWVDAERLTQTNDIFPELFIISSEACEGMGLLPHPQVAPGLWERLEKYAQDIIVDMNHWVRAWVDWNLALDMQGGPNWAKNFVDAAILVNKETDEFYKNPMYYALAHFTKFVPEGAVRIDLTTGDAPDTLVSTAFKNPDGSLVVVLLNRSESSSNVTIGSEGRGDIAFNVGPRSIHSLLFT